MRLAEWVERMAEIRNATKSLPQELEEKRTLEGRSLDVRIILMWI
jgi:hypothetical protein